VFQSGPVVEVKELTERLSEVAASDLTRLTAGEVADLVVASQRLAAAADAVHVAAVARLQVTRSFEDDGARSAAAWVGWKCRVPSGRAHAVARCGRQLRAMPIAEEAFIAGDITVDHVRVLDRAQETAPEVFPEHEAHLVDLARTLRFRQLETVIRYWCHRAAPDGVERDALARYRGRHAHCSSTWEGMVAVDGMLDAIGGEVFGRELARLEEELFDADWAEARERLGDRATKDDLARTAPQRGPTRWWRWRGGQQPVRRARRTLVP
jgi:hypothetical protein